MEIRDEIVARVDKLPAEMQARVLQFVESLETTEGELGADLRPFAGSLDSSSARDIARAIDEACEQVDARDW